MKQFPAAWVMRLNEMVKGLRRRKGWGDIYASVEAAPRPRLSALAASGEGRHADHRTLDPRTIEQVMRTGQEGPLIVSLRLAFLRLLKVSERRGSRRDSNRPRARL